RLHRDRHRNAAHGLVCAGVVGLDHRGLEEERQERSRDEDDDERPQRDLAEHERPVVGEDLASEGLDEARHARALIEVVRGRADEPAAERGLLLFGFGGGAQCISQKLGPTGSLKSLRATRYPSSSTVMGSCGRGRDAGPKTTFASSDTSNCDWWHGHSKWCVCCSYSATGQPTCVHTFEYATMPSYDQSLRSSRSVSCSGRMRTMSTMAFAFSSR